MSSWSRRLKRALAGVGAFALALSLQGVIPAEASPASIPQAKPVASTVKTWVHDNAVATTGPIADDQVRQSPFYTMTVTPARGEKVAHESFVYLSVPRGGKGKVGYTEADGAEYAAKAGHTMSWSSFEYTGDVWVDVKLNTGQTITSADQVTVRPTDLNLKKELVDPSTIRVKVPHSEAGFRFSVEFDPQLVTAYNHLRGGSGGLTTEASGNAAVNTEPLNSMMVFANPSPSAQQAAETIPTEADGTIHRPKPGLVTDLATTAAEIIWFEPGSYHMGSDHHALLPPNVKWVYLAPGAHVKGAFKFLPGDQPSYKVTGLGVLSGEQYVYEADTTNGYRHNVNDNCHVTCVKMLQFESSNRGQTLQLDGVTISDPPYHSFVTYAHRDGVEVPVTDFTMTVGNYKQVGAWYWQTDGIELYANARMKNTFFHANDDVLKLYHSGVRVENTTIWKNENGPVVQWGWGPRTIDDVQVTNTDVIHSRMYWKDVKYNTCLFNSSSHWEDMGATNRADTTATVRNLTFTDTRVEGSINCAIRLYAQANTENITIDGLAIEKWTDLPLSSQASKLELHADRSGKKVTLGNEMTEGNGLLLHNYSVGGVPILKAGNNWASDELGRLDFSAEAWEGWNATADGYSTDRAPQLTLDGPADGTVATSREVTFSGTTDARRLTIRVNGTETPVRVKKGRFSHTVTLTEVTNRVVITATAKSGDMTVDRRTLTAYGEKVGAITDPTGDDHGPGSYTYPTDGAFNPGSFDLTNFAVYRDGDLVRFVTSTAGRINNPWGGNGMSTQRLNVYLADASSTAVTPLLPGTNTSARGAWQYAVVADGRYDSSPLGSGLYGPDRTKLAGVTLDVDPAGTIVASVPASALGDTDLAKVKYQVSMFSDAEGGEGIGNVRPVYSASCAAGVNCPSWLKAYRFGGGAGDFTNATAARDTDTTDSNAIDIISGDQPQSVVMDWRHGPVVVPYVSLG